MDPKILDDLAKQLADAVPEDFHKLGDDLQKNFKAVLNNALARMSLVTREEFDAQRAVLDRTREKLESLEQSLRDLEKSL